MTLRVLFLATRDWYHPESGGGDNVMWEYARYLSSAGHEVTYVAASHPGAAGEANLDGLRVIRLGRVHTLWLRSFVYYMRHARGKVDVVVTEGFGGSRIPRLAPLYVREPVLTEWHQVYRPLFAAQYPRIMHGPLNTLEWLSARAHRGSLVRAGTEDVKQDFIRLGFREESIFVLPVSVRDEWLDDSALADGLEPNFVWVGKVRKYKRPDHAVLALKQVLDHHPAARLTIAGRQDDRDYERRLANLVDEIGLRDKVDFKFNVTEEEKRELLQRSRALVLPSAVEGFGIVVLEANSRGVPVIASSGVPEGAVRDGVNGLRYSYGDVDALAAAMCRVLADDELHRSLSRNARLFAQDFGWLDLGARYAAVVENLVSPIPALTPQPQLEGTVG